MFSKRVLVSFFVASLLISGVLDIAFYVADVEVEPAFDPLARFLAPFFLILWIDADSDDNPEIVKPFDYGFVLWLIWIPYLPYYLWRTRGPWGLAMLAGIVGLFWAGPLVELAIYFYYRA